MYNFKIYLYYFCTKTYNTVKKKSITWIEPRHRVDFDSP